ncbi:MAG: class I tRNA ligase family protein, partial [Caulobacterales bacterium]|nr:class I tRNA ligase family protein [Caulobacterales bacterium]
DPQDIIGRYGAEVLRLWVATSDTTEDLRVGENILKANVDAYRKLRNTVRYLLGALHGFTEDERVAPEDMPGLDRWVLHRLLEVDAEVRAAYERFDLKEAFQAAFLLCTNDLSAFYLDVRKDALYCDRPDSARRRACRTVMDLAFERLAAWLAPVLVFTMEEAWRHRFPDADGSIHMLDFPETPDSWRDEKRAARFERIRRARRVVTGALEGERRDKRIGSSLEAAPELWLADKADRAAFAAEAKASDMSVEAFLAEIAITSQAVLKEGEGPADAFRLEDAPGAAVVPGRAEGRKCARSWRVLPEVGEDARYRDLSLRDADAVAHWDATHGR